jgi:hypothetical protein
MSAVLIVSASSTWRKQHNSLLSPLHNLLRSVRFSAYGPYFQNRNTTIMKSPCSLCVCEPSPHPINFWMPEPMFLKLYIYIYTVYISWHLRPSQRRTSFIPPISQCVSMCSPTVVSRQRLDKNAAAATNTHVTSNKIWILGRFILYSVVSIKESRWLFLPGTFCLLSWSFNINISHDPKLRTPFTTNFASTL